MRETLTIRDMNEAAGEIEGEIETNWADSNERVSKKR
jgi:hypothetical protein